MNATPDASQARQALIDCLRGSGMTAVTARPATSPTTSPTTSTAMAAPPDGEAAPADPGEGAGAGGTPPPPRPARRVHPQGVVLIYSLVILTALLAMASLAVDYGHVQQAKGEVQRAADAAARAGAYQLAAGGDPAVAAAAAVLAAGTIAADNPSDGNPLVLAPGDVQVGNWDDAQTPAFSTARLPLNAVAVAVRRDGTANAQVALTLAPLVGVSSCAVHAAATARVTPPQSPYGLVGLNWVTFGSVGTLAGVTGDLVSNGPVSVGTPLGVGVTVSGNAQSFGAAVARGPAARVQGTTTPLPAALTEPPIVVPATNDNGRIAAFLNGVNDFTAAAGGTVPAGTYVVHDLNVLAGVAVNVAGPVTFYVTGAFNLAAGVDLLGSPNADPANFTVDVVRGGSVNFLANLLTPVAMVIYAPQVPITIAVGVNRFTGTIVGRSLDVMLPVLGSFVEVKPAAKPATVTTEQ